MYNICYKAVLALFSKLAVINIEIIETIVGFLAWDNLWQCRFFYYSYS